MNAAEVDKLADDQKFRLNIEGYALADANGNASPWVSKKLRDPLFVKDWSAALGRIASLAQAPELKRKVQERRVEAAGIKKRVLILNQIDNESIVNKVKNEFGLDFPAGATLHEVEIILLCRILKELKRMT